MRRRELMLSGIGLLCPGGRLLAHHSFSMFDRTRELTIVGTVKEFQWANPHVWIQLLVPDIEGRVVEWSFEGGSTTMLKRHGWTHTSLKPGDRISVVHYPFRSGAPGGCFLEVTRADGAKFFYHG